MTTAQTALYIAAVIVLILGAYVEDHPRLNTIRCIALGLALVLLAQLIH